MTGQISTYSQLGPGRGISYLDFDLEVGQVRQGVYPMLVLRSPAGVASSQMRFPFDEQALKQVLRELQNALLRASPPNRRLLSSEAQTAQAFGQRLFEALFIGEVRRWYARSHQQAVQQGKGLRL